MIDINALAASFRDPSGFVFENDGIIYRQVNLGYRDDFDLYVQSGLHAELVSAEQVVDFKQVSLDFAANSLAEIVIRPTKLDMISYPHEWSFSQLKDAALLTLEIMRLSIGKGMVLKDASAFNIQFIGSRPIFIDTLSFEKYIEGGPWIAYKQFCQHFLAHLALMSFVDVRLGTLFQTNLDGIPLDLAAKLLPFRTKLSPGIAAHIHLHAKAQGADSNSAHSSRQATISKQNLLALIDSLHSTISSLHWKPEGTEWADYYNDTNYTPQALSNKAAIVHSFLTMLPDSVQTCCDLGANNGEFSLIALNRGLKTVALDIDPAAVETCYLRAKQNGYEDLMPLLQDLRNPTPNYGWSSNERDSIIKRSSFDVLLALALVHHLAIGNNVPLPKVAEYFSQLGTYLIVEFVPKEDSQVQRMLVARKDIFGNYNEDQFQIAFLHYFTIIEKQKIEGTSRTVYLMKRS
jgi:ribosomal protein L11 methylase PrmA